MWSFGSWLSLSPGVREPRQEGLGAPTNHPYTSLHTHSELTHQNWVS